MRLKPDLNTNGVVVVYNRLRGCRSLLRSNSQLLYTYLCVLGFAVCLFKMQAGSAYADDVDNRSDTSGGPRVCTGFNPDRRTWGPVEARGVSAENCPSDYAILGYDVNQGRWYENTTRFMISGFCCPLPKGILLDQHVYTDGVCPDGYVATGGKGELVPDTAPPVYYYSLRCTRLNEQKYHLGPPTRGWRVGWLDEPLQEVIKPILFGGEAERTAWSRIPVGLRYGILRAHEYGWSDDGCVGHPWGSILSGREGRDCEDLVFRQVMSNTPEGAEKPVEIYPRCDSLNNIFAPDARCADDAGITPDAHAKPGVSVTSPTKSSQ